jgi:hypothetical protein
MKTIEQQKKRRWKREQIIIVMLIFSAFLPAIDEDTM